MAGSEGCESGGDVYRCKSDSSCNERLSYHTKLVFSIKLTKHPLPMFPRAFPIGNPHECREEDHEAGCPKCRLNIQFPAKPVRGKTTGIKTLTFKNRDIMATYARLATIAPAIVEGVRRPRVK